MTVEERLRVPRPPEEAEAEERSRRVVQAAFETLPVPARRRPAPCALCGWRRSGRCSWPRWLPAGEPSRASSTAATRSSLWPPRGCFGCPRRGGCSCSPSRAPGSCSATVQSDCGPYDDASWSPHGLFVVAARGRDVVALEPGGKLRWSVTAPAAVADPRWAPSGFRIAYRSGNALRVVAGDGSADRELLARVAPVAPAWRAGARHVLLAADGAGRPLAVDADSGRVLWRGVAVAGIRQLAWSADGRRIAVLSRDGVQLLDKGGTVVRALPGATAMAFAPIGHELAVVRGSQLSVGGRRVFAAGAGRLAEPTWSPDGRWLLVGWPAANQWLFIRPDGERLVASASVAQQFDPGAIGSGALRRLLGWAL